MATVLLSPAAGVAAQFFTDTGSVLTGGKLYTYLAGTTTPAATYTSVSGGTTHPNPIVLNAAGRVPNSGEIWLANGVQYKFVLKTSTDVLIATYDNITGAFNPANLQIVNGTGNGVLTVFSMPTTPVSIYQTNIYINGVYQNKNTYTLAGSTFTFSQAPPTTSVIEFQYY
jgi:hypothetical protein